MGFVQSIADPCVFMFADVMCLVYVDNALLFYKSKLAMELLKQKMRDDGMLFCEEDSVAGYLGVHIDCREDSTIHLTQKGLAPCIVENMHLNDKTANPVDTPCTKFLPLDKFGCPAHGEFSYPSIVGQLNYLQGHSQSDITMATSQPSVHIMFIIQNGLTN